jgi:hypothetical protein
LGATHLGFDPFMHEFERVRIGEELQPLRPDHHAGGEQRNHLDQFGVGFSRRHVYPCALRSQQRTCPQSATPSIVAIYPLAPRSSCA